MASFQIHQRVACLRSFTVGGFGCLRRGRSWKTNITKTGWFYTNFWYLRGGRGLQLDMLLRSVLSVAVESMSNTRWGHGGGWHPYYVLQLMTSETEEGLCTYRAFFAEVRVGHLYLWYSGSIPILDQNLTQREIKRKLKMENYVDFSFWLMVKV